MDIAWMVKVIAFLSIAPSWLLVNGFSSNVNIQKIVDCLRTHQHNHFGIGPSRSSLRISNNLHAAEESDEEITMPNIEQQYDRFQKFRTSPHFAPQINKILLLSDLHCDYSSNRDWLAGICAVDKKLCSNSNNNNDHDDGDRLIENLDYSKTMILVAGDVSHDLSILRWTFQTLKQKFGEVAFVPGNHELWIDKKKTAKNTTTAAAANISATASSVNENNSTATTAANYEMVNMFSTGEGDGCVTSIDKLEKILQICVEENVRIGPVRVGVHSNEKYESFVWNYQHDISNSRSAKTESIANITETPGLWVVPLLSYHHMSFDTEPQIDPTCWKGIPSARKVVADYRKTVWPEPLSPLDDSVAEFMDGLNDVILNWDHDVIFSDGGDTVGMTTPILTFSHFLPRIELLPEKRYLSLPTLHSCVGSTFLETRLRHVGHRFGKYRNQNAIEESSLEMSPSTNELSSHADTIDHLHAFGHSHLSWDAIIEGVRYVHVPLAYPREWEERRRSLEIGTMMGEKSENRFPVCVWSNCQSISVDGDDNGTKNILSRNHNFNNGFPDDWLGGWWSKYYTLMERQPHRSKELAPWVARRFRQLPGGTIEEFDHVKMEKKYKLQHPSHWAAGTGQWYQRKRGK